MSEELNGSEIVALRRLLDRQAIVECVARYARGLDRRDEALLKSAYHPDAVEDHAGFVGGVDELVPYLLKVHEPFAGYQRHLTTVNVDIDGDEAHSETYFFSIIRIEQAEKLMVTSGRYLDRFERRDGVWGIVNRVVILEWGGGIEGGPIPSKTHGGPRLDRDDLSYQRPLRVNLPDQAPTAGG